MAFVQLNNWHYPIMAFIHILRFTFGKELRFSLPITPFIFLTAQDGPEDRQTALSGSKPKLAPVACFHFGRSLLFCVMLFMCLWQLLALEPCPSRTEGTLLLIKHSRFSFGCTEVQCTHPVYVSVSISLGGKEGEVSFEVEKPKPKNICCFSIPLFLRSPYSLLFWNKQLLGYQFPGESEKANGWAFHYSTVYKNEIQHTFSSGETIWRSHPSPF